MLYIKNYSSLSSQFHNFKVELRYLTGKNIIVFTDSGGFNGILLEVSNDSIRLRQERRNAIITIMINHIVAFSYNYI